MCRDLYDNVQAGDDIELSLTEGTVTAGSRTFSCTKLPAHLQGILDQGGLIASLDK